MGQMIEGNQQRLDQIPQQQMPALPTPEEIKRERLRKTLASAGQALATTPGNFLTGLAHGSSAAAQTYSDEKSGERDKAMETYDSNEARRQKLLKEMLGGADTLVDNKRADRSQNRADANEAYRRSRHTIADKRYEEQLASAAQKAERATALKLEKLLSDERENLGLNDPLMAPEDRTVAEQMYNSTKERLNQIMGAQPAAATPQPAGTPQIGQTATGPGGKKIVWTENGWEPLN